MVEAVAGLTAVYDENHPNARQCARQLERAAARLAANPQLARITGLTSRPELNGRSAEVLSFCQKKGRFAVRVLPGGEGMNLKPKNLDSPVLDAAADAEPETEASSESVSRASSDAAAAAATPARAASAAPLGLRFVRGSAVELHGLSSEAGRRLNGCTGRVERFEAGHIAGIVDIIRNRD